MSVLLPVTFQHSLVLQIIVYIALDWIGSHAGVRQQKQQFCQFTLKPFCRFALFSALFACSLSLLSWNPLSRNACHCAPFVMAIKSLHFILE